jgi:hypothetical protein
LKPTLDQRVVDSNPPTPTKGFKRLVTVRRRIASFCIATLCLLLAASSGIAATDTRTETTDQTRAAMAQFQASWKGTRADLAERDKSALETRRYLTQTIASLGLKRIEPCPAARLPPSEGAILGRYATMELDFSTRQQREFQLLDQLKAQAHDSYLANAAGEFQAQLARQLAWSGTRLKMIDELHAVFRADYALRRTTAENGCTIRQILALKAGIPDPLRSELSQKLTDIDTTAHEPSASSEGRYRDALDRIAAMP